MITFLLCLFIWWAIGVAILCYSIVLQLDELRMSHVLGNIFFGVLGPIAIIPFLMCFPEDKDIVIWRRK